MSAQSLSKESNMERVCAWCGTRLGYIESSADQDAITHGLCPECAHHLFAQAGMPLEEYLDGLGAPILVVDASGTIQTADRQARALLQKELVEIQGYRGGEVFECVHARLPGGCGNTVHCSGCAIRHTVMETLRTGTGHLCVPAYLDHAAPGGTERIRFLISTEKVDEMILLRIDAVGGSGPC
jgi:PAS domain-containing protein